MDGGTTTLVSILESNFYIPIPYNLRPANMCAQFANFRRKLLSFFPFYATVFRNALRCNNFAGSFFCKVKCLGDPRNTGYLETTNNQVPVHEYPPLFRKPFPTVCYQLRLQSFSRYNFPLHWYHGYFIPPTVVILIGFLNSLQMISMLADNTFWSHIIVPLTIQWFFVPKSFYWIICYILNIPNQELDSPMIFNKSSWDGREGITRWQFWNSLQKAGVGLCENTENTKND